MVPARASPGSGGILPSAAAAILPRPAWLWPAAGLPWRPAGVPAPACTTNRLCVSRLRCRKHEAPSHHATTLLMQSALGSRQQPTNQRSDSGTGCLACLAGACLCCCAEGSCFLLLLHGMVDYVSLQRCCATVYFRTLQVLHCRRRISGSKGGSTSHGSFHTISITPRVLYQTGRVL